MDVKQSQVITAEAVGTFLLTFGGCGTAVLAGHKVGWLGVALAFGLTVVVGAYAVGHLSGGHFNPAVTFGLAIAGRVSWKQVPVYWATQVVAAIAAGAVLLAIASGTAGFSAVESGFASNGFGDRSPEGYGMFAALLIEVLLTAVFLIVILGVTDTRAPKGFAPLAIGLSLTLIHLIAIPVTNTSVNPARSIGVGLFAGPEAIAQLWLFIVAPLIGAALGALLFKSVLERGGEVTLTEAVEG